MTQYRGEHYVVTHGRHRAAIPPPIAGSALLVGSGALAAAAVVAIAMPANDPADIRADEPTGGVYRPAVTAPGPDAPEASRSSRPVELAVLQAHGAGRTWCFACSATPSEAQNAEAHNRADASTSGGLEARVAEGAGPSILPTSVAPAPTSPPVPSAAALSTTPPVHPATGSSPTPTTGSVPDRSASRPSPADRPPREPRTTTPTPTTPTTETRPDRAPDHGGRPAGPPAAEPHARDTHPANSTPGRHRAGPPASVDRPAPADAAAQHASGRHRADAPGPARGRSDGGRHGADRSAHANDGGPAGSARPHP